MKFRIRLTLNDIKKCPIYSGYRPTWMCDSKPDQNSGMVYWSGGNAVKPGETQEGFLQPLASEYWEKVGLNDTLKCMEGSRVVGTAVVLEILPDVPVV